MVPQTHSNDVKKSFPTDLGYLTLLSKNSVMERKGFYPDIRSDRRPRHQNFSVLERPRDPRFILERFKNASDKFILKYLLCDSIPLAEKQKYYDLFLYGYTCLFENLDEFKQSQLDCEMELDDSARMQTAIDFFVKVAEIDILPGRRALTTVPLEKEDRIPYLLNYLGHHLNSEEASAFEENLLSDLGTNEAVFLNRNPKNKIKESTTLKQRTYFNLRPAFDYQNQFYNSVPSYERGLWFSTILLLLAILVAFIKRDKNSN